MTMVHTPSSFDDRGLLADRGATAEEIDAHAQEAERVRSRLAELIGSP